MLFKNKQWMTIIISIILISYTIVFWKEISILPLISILLFTSSLFLLNKSKVQSRKVDELEERNQWLLDELITKEKRYMKQISGLPAMVFSFDVKSDEWFISKKVQEYLNDQEDQNDLRVFENRIHPEDKGRYFKKKEAWLKGVPFAYEFRILLEDGQIRWNELRTSSITSSTGEVEMITGIMMDTTDRKEKEEKLKQMAFYDSLTELPNRTMLQNHLNKAISRANRKDHEVTIMFIDLDGFKEVNDSFGHDIGDALLKEVANRLTKSVREEDLISRLGGDEFIIVFEETEKNEISVIADRILTNISTLYHIEEHDVSVTPSIGISNFPEDGENLEALVINADKAMYYAKSIGKNNYQFYSSDLEDYKPKESLIDKVLKWFQK